MREDDGVVSVYHTVDPARLRREALIGFYVWAGEAAALVEDANRAKQEDLAENPDRPLPDVFWEFFDEDA